MSRTVITSALRPFRSGVVWSFRTARFEIELRATRDRGFRYDGDDDGTTQANLDSGEWVAFDTAVTVTLDGVEIGADHLGASVYGRETASEFWTAHRSADPMNRNCEAMRAARGGNVCIAHYFPDMVREAVRMAREELARRPVPPVMRAAA